MQNNQNRITKKLSYLRIIVRPSVFILLVSASPFIPAGRVTYWQGWVFVGSYLSSCVTIFVLFRHKKDLMAERARPGPGAKWWDKIFFALYLPASLLIGGVAGLDAGRFGWTGPLPAVVYVVSYIVLFLSFSGLAWAMWTNKFFSRVVRIQTDRGQYVVQEGPYRFVRHPGYLACSFALFSMALVLGSLWALVPAGVSVVLFVARTYLEDITLQKELPGYADYAKKVNYRLLPYIW